MQEALKDALTKAHIQYADLVDDAYDSAPSSGLPDEEISTFISELDDSAFDRLGQILGLEVVDDDQVIARLATADGAVQLYTERATFGPPADKLFEGFTTDTKTSQQNLRPLIELLEHCGVTCRTYGQDYIPDAEAPQIIFIDLKLTHGSEINLSIPVAVLKRLQEHHPDAYPIVFLMSSLDEPLDNYREQFREQTDLLATQFEALRKTIITTNKSDLIRQLTEHANARPYIEQLARHRTGWGQAIEHAKASLLKTLCDLDLPDYFVLKDVSALKEGTGLGSYITDLLLEHLAYYVEGSREIAGFAKDLDEWGEDQLPRTRFHAEPATQRVFSSNVLRHHEWIEGEKQRSGGADSQRLHLGDIFLSGELNESQLPKRAVVVLTPECDLARPEEMKKRCANALLCEGDVKLFDQYVSVRNQGGDATPVLLPYEILGQTTPVVIQIFWRKKRPVVWTLQEISERHEGVPPKWVHSGRLRPLFALELQHAVTADLARVGVQAAPAIYRPHGLSILVRKDNKWETLSDTWKSDATASAVCDDSKIVYMIRDEILRDCLGKIAEWCEQTEVSDEPYISLHALVDNERAYAALKYRVLKNKRDEETLPLRDVAGIPSEQQSLICFARPERNGNDTKYAPGRAVESENDENSQVVFRFHPIKDD